MAKKKRRGRKKGVKNKKNRGLSIGLKRETVISVFQVGLFAVAGLILVSFARQGSMLVRINDALVSYFGWTTIFLPFILISLGFLSSSLKIALGQPNVTIGVLLFFLSIATLTRSGNFGKSAWEGVAILITTPGAFVLLLGTSLVGLVILFNTSFDRALVFLGNILAKARAVLVGEKTAVKIKPML